MDHALYKAYVAGGSGSGLVAGACTLCLRCTGLRDNVSLVRRYRVRQIASLWTFGWWDSQHILHQLLLYAWTFGPNQAE